MALEEAVHVLNMFQDYTAQFKSHPEDPSLGCSLALPTAAIDHPGQSVQGRHQPLDSSCPHTVCFTVSGLWQSPAWKPILAWCAVPRCGGHSLASRVMSTCVQTCILLTCDLKKCSCPFKLLFPHLCSRAKTHTEENTCNTELRFPA